MSLTKLLKSSPDLRKMIPNFKLQLKNINGKELSSLDWKTQIVIPSIGKSHEAGTIGTAFDYVARVILTRIVGTDNVTKEPLVAINGARAISNALRRQDATLLYEHVESIRKERLEGCTLARENESELKQYIEAHLDSALQAMVEYVSGNLTIKELALHTVFLARLDEVYRAGSVAVVDGFLEQKYKKSYFSQKLTVTDDDLANNVVQLAEVFEKHFGDVPMSQALLNPVFMPYSGIVGGADADFIFDSTLIDIKSANRIAYSTEDWSQVLGYVAMALASGIQIERAGIYFARYGISTIYDISSSTKAFLSEYLKAILETTEQKGGRIYGA